ncbi:MAG: tripartite tricarboxylate transporter substrate binding protein [Burkholderiales bacterium]|nr:tripartite tricarboxylate transporter substrate binding protein [Burkholderiales bacterium]
MRTVRLAVIALCSAAALAASAAASAQGFPQPGRAVRIIVPFPPGGQTDIHARLVAPRLADALGVPVVVENKPGASTALGATEVARAAADGHTLLYANPTAHTQLPHLTGKLAYDPFRDFTPIVSFVRAATVLVATPAVPAANVRELVAHAKANPGKLNYASVSPGSSSHLNAEMLKMQAGIDILHVPYKGSADAIRDLFGGQVQLMFDGLATAVANVRAGRVKALGVADTRRNPALPDVPTFTEQGVAGIDIFGWIGFFGPGGLPRETTARLNADLNRILALPEIRDAVLKGGNDPDGGSAEDFARTVRDQHERWGRVIRSLGLKLD